MKRVLVIILAIIMSLSIIVVHAEDEITGKNGSVSWKVEGAELIFYPTNNEVGTFEGNFTNAEWKNYSDQITKVKIEGTINMPELSSGFMSGMSNLESFSFKNLNFDKTTDMKSFFDGCSSLSSVNFAGVNLKSVKGLEYIFRNCTSLTEFSFSNVAGFKSSPRLYQAFSGCKNLTSIDFGDITINGTNSNTLSGIFNGCNKLTTVIIPESVDFSLASSSIGGPAADSSQYWENNNSNKDFKSLTELSKNWSSDLAGTWKIGNKRGKVIVEYIDLSTNKALSESTVLSNLKYGSEYTVEPVTKSGYEVINLKVNGESQDPKALTATVKQEEIKYVYEYYKIGEYKYNDKKLINVKSDKSFNVYKLSANKVQKNSYYNQYIDDIETRLNKYFSDNATQWKKLGSTKKEAILAIIYWKDYETQKYLDWIFTASSSNSDYPITKTYKDIPEKDKKGLSLELYVSTLKDGVDVCAYKLTKLYVATYEFKSANEDMTLPDEILELLPKDSKYYKNSEEVKVIQPKETEIEAEHGTWYFSKYDKSSIKIDNNDVKFVGYWDYIEDEKFEETYYYSNWDLPTEVEKTLPIVKTTHYKGEKVRPKNPSKTRIVLDNGEWIFDGWDEDYIIVEDQDIEFNGHWTFTSYMRKVTFMDDTGKVIETKEVKIGESVIPPTPTKTGYVFKEWDKPLNNITENTTIRAIFEKKPFDVFNLNIKVENKIVNGTEDSRLKVIVEPIDNAPEQLGILVGSSTESVLSFNFTEPGEYLYKVYLDKSAEGFMIDPAEYTVEFKIDEVLNRDGNNGLNGVRNVTKNNVTSIDISFKSTKAQSTTAPTTERNTVKEEKESNTLFWVLISIISVAIVACIIILLVIIKKKDEY